MMDAPLVSIIVPMFNCAAFLNKTINSIQQQTYSDWELFLIDDCSEDNSPELACEYKNTDKRIHVIVLSENSGPAVARNKGIEAANGRYIAFLDSDDVWLPEKLERQVAFMQQNASALSFTQVERVDVSGKLIGITQFSGKVTYSELLKTNVIVCSSAMYDVAQLGKVYMPLIRKRQDFGLWLRLLKLTAFADGLQETLVRYTVRQNSVSANKKSAALFTWKIYRQQEGLSLFKSSYYFAHYACSAVIRTRFPRLAKRLGWLE